jgi:hypothetical protein
MNREKGLAERAGSDTCGLVDSDSRPWVLRAPMRRPQIASPLFLKMLEGIRVSH